MSLGAILLAENILSVDGSFLLSFVAILLLIFILNATLFRPINRVLEERERLGGGRMAEARHLMAQYEQRLQQYEAQIREARAAAYQQAEARHKQAQAARQELINQVKAEAAQQIEVARGEISAQVEAARGNLTREAQTMAARISSQILHRPVSGPAANSPEGIRLS